MRFKTVFALCVAAAGLVASVPAANAMPAAPENTIAIQSDDAGVTAAHWTRYYHRHWRPRPVYRPYRPYYRARPYYGYRGGYGYHHRRW